MKKMIEEFRRIALSTNHLDFISDDEFLAYLEYGGLMNLCNIGEGEFTFSSEDAEFLRNFSTRLAARFLGTDIYTLDEILEDASGFEEE